MYQKIVTRTWLHLYSIHVKNPSKLQKTIVTFPCTSDPEVTHIRVLFLPQKLDVFCFHNSIKKMSSNTLYIPPSDEDLSDNEVFQHFLEINKIQRVSTPEYHPQSSNFIYSELAPFEPSKTRGKVIFHFMHIFFCKVPTLFHILHN